jgi:hypothetical protein
MNIYKKFATIFFIMMFLTGCATTGTDQKAAKLPSGSIHIDEWQILALAETQFGHGTLGFNGKTYKFKILGFGAGGVGVHKISVTGHVYNLDNVADFSGYYFAARAGLTVAKGVGGLWVINNKDVTLHLKTHAEGLALAIGVDGLQIKLE